MNRFHISEAREAEKTATTEVTTANTNAAIIAGQTTAPPLDASFTTGHSPSLSLLMMSHRNAKMTKMAPSHPKPDADGTYQAIANSMTETSSNATIGWV
jgi:hypothetical protein